MNVLDFSTPHVLRNAREFKAAVAEIDQLLDEDAKRGTAAYDRLKFLSVLVEAYEDEHDPIDCLGHAASLCICNVAESALVRASAMSMLTRAGPEIGVASTKAFTTQLVAMTLLAIHLGRRTKALSKERARALLAELVQLPQKMRDIVESGAQLQVLARRYGMPSPKGFATRPSRCCTTCVSSCPSSSCPRGL